MKVALVHDQLQEFGGAERVLVALHQIFPHAPVFTAFFNKSAITKHIPDFNDWNVRSSWAARLPFFGKLYSPLRFLAPAIWERFDFSDFDVVISSSGWYMCKGIKTKKPTVHISYLHHPPRYLYGYETAVEYQKYWPVKIYAAIVNHRLRQWDFESSQRVNYFIANSEETKKRIKKFYRRGATVIYPPVAIPEDVTKNYEPRTMNYYVTIARLARAKHIDILIQSANKLGFTLKIIGEGRDKAYLQSIAGPTIEFLGHVPDEEFPTILSSARAFLFASVDEEFGIAPVEAMGYGVPVVAYKSGGLKETVKDGVNGYLFEELREQSLEEKIKKLESLPKEKYLEMRAAARAESEKYSFARFRKEILALVSKLQE